MKHLNKTILSDKSSEHNNSEYTYWFFEEHLNEETESILATRYTLLNEINIKMLDYEGINNYYLLQTSLANIIKVLINYEESDIDSLYEITDNELLSETSVNSDESDIEVLTNNVLENMTSDFKEFDSKYGSYFPNFTSMLIFT
ncbi:15312_t:CDS:2 [Cetraspora pellucida]|uniref:15312_t:CDS:1 n=1 Tax=Cetraspora pellucida TaxID=1433469 RepID=A0ACA9NCX8_9GLOM|nr:15312_t:CDS:2 [Cetraspora pellucida]